MNSPISGYESFRSITGEQYTPEFISTADDLRAWLRRRLIVRVTIFIICLVASGLLLFLIK